MNFVFISYNYSPGFNNPEDWITRIKAYKGSLECLSNNHTVTRIEQINYTGQYFKNGVNYHFTNLGKNHPYFPWRLNRLVKSLKPNVIVIHGTHYPLQVIQLRLLLGKGCRIIIQHHAEQPFTGIKKYIQRVAGNCADAYLFASQGLGLDWVNKGNIASSKKVHEVMEVSSVFYPVDRSLALAKTGIKGSPVFLWVGRLNDNKDPLNVVSAFLKFAAGTSAVLYMIYHTDELLDDIKQLIKNHPDESAIQLIGRVPKDDLLYWYNSADFILSGSHYEGSGTAICEAMSCGCIPIVTDIFSFRMITDEGKCGLLYEAGNETALLAALQQTRQMNVEEKRNRCLEYFKSKLSFEAIAQQLQDIAASL